MIQVDTTLLDKCNSRGQEKRVPGDQPIAWPKAEEPFRALAQLPERKGGICVSTVSIVCGLLDSCGGGREPGRQLSSQAGYAGP
jgi:hypothetical protein